MGQYEEDEFDIEDLEDYSGADLVKKLRKQVSALSRQVKERDAALEEFYSDQHQQGVSDMLAELGLNPKIAAFIPDDVESQDDLELWLEAYGDAFGVQAVDEGESYFDDPAVQAAELMSAVEEGGIDPTVGHDLMARIAGAETPEALAALLRG